MSNEVQTVQNQSLSIQGAPDFFETMPSLKLDKAAEFNAVQNAKGLGEVRLKNEKDDVEIAVAGLSVGMAEIADEKTGEVKNMIGVTFIAQDGSSIFSISEAIVQGARNLVKVYGLPSSWKNAIKIQLSLGRTAKGNPINRMTVVG